MAVSLAIKFGYKDIRIIGMDLNQAGHFYDNTRYDYSNTIEHMQQLEDKLIDMGSDIKISRFDYGDWEGFERKNLHEIL